MRIQRSSVSSRSCLLFGLSSLVAAGSASAQTLIADDFEVDSSANYTIVDDGTPDGSQAFAFDYSAVGIPAAPRSAMGATNGLRVTANDTAGVVDATSCFHNTVVTADHYRLTVDIWMNFAAPAGSTEFSHVGVGGDGATFNQVFLPISGSGAFIAFTGDGGSSSDYRWFRDANNTPMGEMSNTTLPSDHPSYLGNGANASGAFYQALFPSPPATIQGSPGNIWTTLEIDVDNVNGVISFSFDGQLTFQGNFANDFNGQVSLGIADTFPSISGASDLFTLYDNLEVEIVNDTIGTNYCMANANSTGSTGVMSAIGSDVAADNDVTLVASQLPSSAFGFFITSQTQGFVANPNGSQGNLCVSGTIGRYVGAGQIQNSGMGDSFTLVLDLTQTPTPTALVSVNGGETWNFQAWHRDSVMGMPTSNFTDGVSVMFL